MRETAPHVMEAMTHGRDSRQVGSRRGWGGGGGGSGSDCEGRWQAQHSPGTHVREAQPLW